MVLDVLINTKTNDSATKKTNDEIASRPPQDIDVLAVLVQDSWISEFLVYVLRLLLCIPEVCSPTTKAVDEKGTSATALGKGTSSSNIQESWNRTARGRPVEP